MKLAYTTIAALLIGTASFADAPDLSGYNNGLPVRVTCSNVPAWSETGLVSVSGVFLEHGGPAGYIVDEAGLPYVTTDRIIGVMPRGMSTKDSEDMNRFLLSAGLTNYALVIRPDRDSRTEVEQVTTVAERGVATGPVPDRDNLTSMGVAASNGANVLRVRSSVAQDVSIRRAGGDTFTVSVGAGDTLVDVPTGGTYIATFTGTGSKNTKATGHQAFNDLTVTEQDRIIRTTRNGNWCG